VDKNENFQDGFWQKIFIKFALAIYVNLLDGLNAVLLCMGIFLIGNY
jgi:hypothetical protein